MYLYMIVEMRDVCLSVCLCGKIEGGGVCVCVCGGGELREGMLKKGGIGGGMGWMDEKGKNHKRDISKSIYIYILCNVR